jgi:hypothetical protein
VSSAVRAFVAQAEQAPASIGVTTSLPSKPAAGKHLVYLECLQGCNQLLSGAQAAAKLLGWTVSAITTGNTPQAIANAWSQAIAEKPDGILDPGIECSQVPVQCAQARQAGIPIVSDGLSEWGAPIVANVHGQSSLNLQCQDLAEYLDMVSGGTASVEYVSTSDYKSVVGCGTTLQSTLTSLCPKCHVYITNIALTSIGTTLPSQIVSILQSNPSIHYLFYGFSEMGTGVPTALKQAGISYPTIVGTSPLAVNFADILNGTENAYTISTNIEGGWLMIDSFARYFEHVSLAPENNLKAPTQIITKSNLPSTDPNADNDYQGIPNYPAQFEALWHVS